MQNTSPRSPFPKKKKNLRKTKMANIRPGRQAHPILSTQSDKHNNNIKILKHHESHCTGYNKSLVGTASVPAIGARCKSPT